MADTYDSKTHRDEYGVTAPAWAASGAPAEIPKITGKAELDALAPGSEFMDPTGTKRGEPYIVKQPADVKNVPEGATFIDPQGTSRQRPTSKGWITTRSSWSTWPTATTSRSRPSSRAR